MLLEPIDGLHHAVGDGQFLDRHLQHERAHGEDALAQLARGLDGRAAAEHGGPRRKGAEAVRRRGGVVGDAGDVLELDAELVRRDLPHRRHDALALRRQRRGDGEHAGRFQAQGHGVAAGLQQRAGPDRRAGAKPGQLRVAGDADAAQLAVGPRVALLGAQPLIVRLGDRRASGTAGSSRCHARDCWRCDKASPRLGIRLRWRISTGSSFSRRATSSISNSSDADADGRPTAR